VVAELAADGQVVGATVDASVVAELELADGTWHARYPDPSGGCDVLVVSFDAHEPAAGVPRRGDAIEGGGELVDGLPSWAVVSGGAP